MPPALRRSLVAAVVGLSTCLGAVDARGDDWRWVAADGAPTADAAEGAVVAQVAPNAPQGLVVQAIRTDAVALSWRDTAPNEAGFVVEAAVADGSPLVQVGDVLPPNTGGAIVTGLAPATEYFFRVRAKNAGGTSGGTSRTATTLASNDCAATPNAVCLANDRFRVQALFVTPQAGTGPADGSGEAHAVKLTADSGYLWFFGPANIEAVVKVLSACGVNQRYWVFAGGLTDVQVMLTVTDTAHGTSRAYLNPLGKAWLPIQDTAAFATCP